MDFVTEIRRLVASGSVRTSDHAYGRLQEKDISYRQLVSSLESAEVLETYPDYRHGPCFLARHQFAEEKIAHAVWGLPLGSRETAVLVTAYWPDRNEWDASLRRRR
ncbi:MAG: DUF4258 domain-containing protein [Rhizobiaceae bacterium]|nr:DUF4258 domain-containing protein [Rhizobiaceae bacterium]